jgi:hypothetical protein
MPYWSWITVPFPTPLIFRYHLPLICLSAHKICQPFSWGGNFYVDSGSWVTSSEVQTRFSTVWDIVSGKWNTYDDIVFWIANGSYILICPYWENRNPHFLNLQDSTHPLVFTMYSTVYTHAKQTGMEGGRGPSERRLERQQFTRWVKNTNMRECISSL